MVPEQMVPEKMAPQLIFPVQMVLELMVPELMFPEVPTQFIERRFIEDIPVLSNHLRLLYRNCGFLLFIVIFIPLFCLTGHCTNPIFRYLNYIMFLLCFTCKKLPVCMLTCFSCLFVASATFVS